MAHTICLLPGDGIGPEVTTAARQVIEAAGLVGAAYFMFRHFMPMH